MCSEPRLGHRREVFPRKIFIKKGGRRRVTPGLKAGFVCVHKVEHRHKKACRGVEPREKPDLSCQKEAPRQQRAKMTRETEQMGKYATTNKNNG
jgi:hypothetical protein